jgi:glycosyltransferase involved in cell wall biosynthesis
MKITVIIPFYKKIEYLEKLLSTIPNTPSIQIIVVDDSSKLPFYQQKRLIQLTESKNIHLIFNETNKGAGYCRNVGLKHARGEWVIFADTDDLFNINFYDTLCEYDDSPAQVIFFPPEGCDNKNNERGEIYKKIVLSYFNRPNYKNELKLRYSFPGPISKMYKLDFLQQNSIKFDEVIASNDVMFSINVGYRMSKFEVSSKNIYIINEIKGSLTKTRSKKMFYSRFDVFIRKYSFLLEKISSEDFHSLELYGQQYLMDALRYKLSVKEFISVFFRLKKQKIKIFDPKILNPIYFFKKLFEIIIKELKSKNHFDYEK